MAKHLEHPSSTIDLHQALAIGTPKAVELWLDLVDDPTQRADELKGLTKKEVVRLSELIPLPEAVDLLDTLDLHTAVDAIRVVPTQTAADVFSGLETDRAAELLRELTPNEGHQILSHMPKARADVLRGLLSWPEESVAAHMVPDVITISEDLTAGEAIARVRNHSAKLRQDSHIGSYLFAVDNAGRLDGVVAFRELVLADPDTPVPDLVTQEVIKVSALTDQEEASQILFRHRLLALPVVDDEDHLLGILTADDANDIAEEEWTEDAERQGGSQPLDVPYLRASPVLLWRKRIVWLLLLFVAEMYTGNVMKAFEDELDTVTALAFFVPLLIGTGGNTGTQVTTTLIRAMSTENVRLRDIGRVVTKELSAGFFIALTMGVAGFLRAWMLGVEIQIMVTIALSLGAIILWSSFIASMIPLLLKKLRVDPAVVSGPMISTLVDGTGLLIYFWIAKSTLPELGGSLLWS